MTLGEFMQHTDGIVAITCGQAFFFIGDEDEWESIRYRINHDFRKKYRKHGLPFKDLWEWEVIESYVTDYYGYRVVVIDGVERRRQMTPYRGFWFKSEYDEIYGR